MESIPPPDSGRLWGREFWDELRPERHAAASGGVHLLCRSVGRDPGACLLPYRQLT